MSVNERIKTLIDSQENGSQSRFARRVGVTTSVVNSFLPKDGEGRVSKPGYDVLHKILEAYPEISADWLLMGTGDLLRNDLGRDAEGYFSRNKMQNVHGSQIGSNSGNFVGQNDATQLHFLGLENEGLRKRLEDKDELIKDLRERIEEYKETIRELKGKQG